MTRAGCSRFRVAGLALVGLVAAALPASAATRYNPRLHFRTLTTPRFEIHFHQGEDAAAARLARIAEEVATSLDRTLGPAAGRVHVILVNQSDQPNGWATPVPYNLIEITAAGPSGESLIGNTDDWLRLVFTHEYTHIVHLGRASGWIGGLRRVFGRNPALFPNLSQPLWAIEGMATFEESAAGRGRVNAGDFRQIVTRAAAGSRFEPLDRIGGGLNDFPGGNAQYAYGGLFHRFLADTYGEPTLRRLTDETARRLPYLGFTAYRTVFGKSLGALWRDFAADALAKNTVAAAAAQQLTHHGFSVAGPRFAPDGRLYYSVANPEGFPALMSLAPGASAPRRAADRYLGERSSISGRLLVFDQIDVAANVAGARDLYAFDVEDRGMTRLTRGLRAADADVSPDGARVVFTRQLGDRRDLATASLERTPRPTLSPPVALASHADTEFAAPRWSPDGRWIAVERHVRGELPAIAIVDAATGATRVVAASAAARCVSPAWLPGGQRLLFAANPADAPFTIFAVDVATGVIERLDGVPSGRSPEVSADGRTLVFVGYTPEGDDLFTLPLQGATWSRAAWTPPGIRVVPADPVPIDAPPYRPWNTLAPRFWTPTVGTDSAETFAGVAVSGSDALGRHGYGAAVSWSSRPRPDWQIAYAYDRWWPTVFASVADDTDPFRRGEARSTALDAGILLPWRRVRWAQSLFGALHLSTDTARCAACDQPIDARSVRRALRAGYTLTTARTYGYSISREQGWALTTSYEAVRRALGSDGDAGSVVADVRRYQPAGIAHGVIAARIAGATAWGDERARREFTDAGDGPQPGTLDFDADAIGLVRGFDDDRRGPHALVANLEYRVPLRRVQRGLGTWPVFVRSVHGAVFADAGQAWNRAFRARAARLSFGVELSADT
ncbi:MAG: hypothetical protein ABIX28_18525, partial [Vicinamibacterales bacterium]